MTRRLLSLLLILLATGSLAQAQFAPIGGFREVEHLPEAAEGNYYYIEPDGNLLILDMRSFRLTRLHPEGEAELIADGSLTAAQHSYPEGVAIQWQEQTSEILAVTGGWLCILSADNLPVLVPTADPARYVPLDTSLRGLSYGPHHGLANWRQAAFAGTNLVVAGDGNLLQAFSTDGSLAWEFMAGDNPRLLKAADDPGLLVFSGQDCLCRLEPDGSCSWAEYGLNMAVSDGQQMIVGITNGGELRCLDFSGRENWRYKPRGLQLPVGITDGRILIYGNRNQLSCLANDGSLIWECRVPVGELGAIRVTALETGEFIINARVQKPISDLPLLRGRYFIAIHDLEYHIDVFGNVLLQSGSDVEKFPLEFSGKLNGSVDSAPSTTIQDMLRALP